MHIVFFYIQGGLKLSLQYYKMYYVPVVEVT